MPFEEDSGDFLSGADITSRTLGSPPTRGSAGPGTRSIRERSWIACRSTRGSPSSASHCSCFSLTV
jgi:hypothetical protein